MSTSRQTTDSARRPSGPLLVRLCNWVGEAVLSLPALRRLAEAGYQLHLYGRGWAPALFEGTGWPVTVRGGGVTQATAQLRALRRTLSAAEPVPALLMTNSFASALETRLAGFAPSGFARECRGPLLCSAYPWPGIAQAGPGFATSGFAHAAEAYWQLASSFLGTEEGFPARLDWTPSETQRARALALLSRYGLDAGSFVVLCPFSGPDDREHQKVWPGFRELGAKLAASGASAVVCPGPGEQAVDAGAQAVCLPGVDLGVYGALFKLARSVVANDTGPGHLAAAAGARLVSVQGPQSSAVWRPIGPGVRLFQSALEWPSVDSVAAAALETFF
jgi:heptosyltransferase-2